MQSMLTDFVFRYETQNPWRCCLPVLRLGHEAEGCPEVGQRLPGVGVLRTDSGRLLQQGQRFPGAKRFRQLSEEEFDE